MNKAQTLEKFDVIIVGSGPSGAMAAQTVLEGGVKLCMIDVGNKDEQYKQIIPNERFVDIRNSDSRQHQYMLGEKFEGIQFGDIKTAAQLTPPRQFVINDTDSWSRSETKNFSLVESLAYGGLGEAWGLGSFALTDNEIESIGLNPNDIREAYNVISKRIGISALGDDAAPYCMNGLQDTLPAVTMEPTIAHIYQAYKKKSASLNKMDVYLGRTPLAILTQQLEERKATAYHDMDFWSNDGLSAYRPSITIDTLRNNNNFTYINKKLVLSFSEDQNGVQVHTISTEDGSKQVFHASKLILAAGTFGTARIVIRSSSQKDIQLPFVCGAYVYYPCIQPRTFGTPQQDNKVGYSQVSLFYNDKDDVRGNATAQLYTYSSLMLHRLAAELPLNFNDILSLLRLGTPNLVIAGIHQPGERSEQKWIKLSADKESMTSDKLIVNYEETANEKRIFKRNERIMKRALRKIGCIPVKRIDPGPGSSIHYGGTLPFCDDGDQFTLSKNGLLSQHNNVYIADGSGFNFMPAKGPTLTFMANAHNVAKHVLSALDKDRQTTHN